MHFCILRHVVTICHLCSTTSNTHLLPKPNPLQQGRHSHCRCANSAVCSTGGPVADRAHHVRKPSGSGRVCMCCMNMPSRHICCMMCNSRILAFTFLFSHLVSNGGNRTPVSDRCVPSGDTVHLHSQSLTSCDHLSFCSSHTIQRIP